MLSLSNKQARMDIFHELHCITRRVTHYEPYNNQTRARVRAEFQKYLNDMLNDGNIRSYTIDIDPLNPYGLSKKLDYKVVLKAPVHTLPDVNYIFTNNRIIVEHNNG